MHTSAFSVRHASTAGTLPQMSLPRLPKSDLVQLHKETWVSRMISRALCVGMALLAIPGMVVGLVFLLGWAVRKGAVSLTARIQGKALPKAESEFEFPAMWE
ncbi:hypothetical protein [Silvibacterium sp.]|uniref:hypothetical protein n=1 Tax=Silvibacterium sp. TaxID=1964179 RepID=UPI0039E48F59